METKFRVVALCSHGNEIGSWVFDGPREKAIAKAIGVLLDAGIVPAEIHAEPQIDYSLSMVGRY